jgi:ABC-2 type transport system permease protein
MLTSSLYPRFRDVAIIWTVFSTALFYATPVLYPISSPSVSDDLKSVIELNPLAPIFELVHKWIIDPDAPGPVALTGARLLIPIAIYVVTCALAVWTFNREAPRIAEAL